MTTIARTLGVARSTLTDRLAGRTRPRRRYHKAQDAGLEPILTALVAERPTVSAEAWPFSLVARE